MCAAGRISRREIGSMEISKSPSVDRGATFTTPAQEHQAARRRGVLTEKVKNVTGVAQSLNSDMVNELTRIDSFLGTFMGKLGDLVGVYETEKSCLERGLLEVLDQGKSGLVDDIIKSKASARQYSEMVQEHFEKSTALIREGFQNRRNLEAAFNEQMLDVVRGEYEEIIASMRAEDRKKLHFDRLENHKKLESCRIAVRIDMAAMLLQQRANLDRQRKEEVTKMAEEMRVANEENDSKLVQVTIVTPQIREFRSSQPCVGPYLSCKLRARVEGPWSRVSDDGRVPVCNGQNALRVRANPSTLPDPAKPRRLRVCVRVRVRADEAQHVRGQARGKQRAARAQGRRP